MQPTDITVQVRNVNLAILGSIPNTEMNFKFHKLYANIGTWELVLPATHSMVEALDTPGSGLVISLNGTVIGSGPTLNPTVTQKYDDPKGMVKFKGVTDTVVVQDALGFPDPTNPAGSQTKDQDKRTGACETLMHNYVRDNIGPSATAARKNPKLTMGTNGARGKTVTRKPRFGNLGILVAGLAKSGRLGFEVIQVGTALEFRTYAVRDRTALITLNVEDGSITSSEMEWRALPATNVIVGGRGHGKKRKFRDVSTVESNTVSNDWGRRIEVYMDYRGADETPEATDLEAAGTEFLDDEMEHPFQLKVTPSEWADYAYGNQWQLGDKVLVKVRGKDRAVTATGLILRVDENGARYGMTFGDPTMADGATAGGASNTQRSDRPGKADSTKHWSDHMPTEVPDLSEYTLDGVDYVVENRVLLLENGQTVPEYVALHGDVPIQVGTIVFEKV